LANVSFARYFLWCDFACSTSVNIDTAHLANVSFARYVLWCDFACSTSVNIDTAHLANVSFARYFLWCDFARSTSVNIDTAHCDSRQRVSLTVTRVYVVPPKVSYIIISGITVGTL